MYILYFVILISWKNSCSLKPVSEMEEKTVHVAFSISVQKACAIIVEQKILGLGTELE
jgi:hypothetical protein